MSRTLSDGRPMIAPARGPACPVPMIPLIVSEHIPPERPTKSNRGNVREVYAGRSYASKREARFAADLDLLRLEGRIASWEAQPRYSLEVPAPRGIEGGAVRVAGYRPDFRVVLADGRRCVVEVKGRWEDVARLRVKLFAATALRADPGLTLCIVGAQVDGDPWPTFDEFLDGRHAKPRH